ncbi:hypothetical protein Fmac_032962 [Flemingia macrophylla]|uniref:Uncharacterized protein n=1 Tax=Flemingia macrophylla TaxID=520843 RepID=A0ABD1L6F6_9FABA
MSGFNTNGVNPTPWTRNSLAPRHVGVHLSQDMLLGLRDSCGPTRVSQAQLRVLREVDAQRGLRDLVGSFAPSPTTLLVARCTLRDQSTFHVCNPYSTSSVDCHVYNGVFLARVLFVMSHVGYFIPLPRPWAARSSTRASCDEVVDARELRRGRQCARATTEDGGARELPWRTVARFLEDLGSTGVEEREDIDDAIRHMYSSDLKNGWGIHVFQEVKLLAKKEDRFALNSAIDELIHLDMQSARESEIERNKMKAEEAEAENEGLRKEL